MASEYHWTPRQVECELTDEHLVLLLDEATDRRVAQACAKFDSLVEAVRAGSIFAHDDKQHARWRADNARQSGRRLASATTIEQLAREFPDHVGLPN